MRHLPRSILAGICVIGLAWLTGNGSFAAANPTTRLEIIQGSWVQIDGTTSLHDWRARNDDVSGFIYTTPEAQPGQVIGFAALGPDGQAEVSIPISGLKSIDLEGKPYSARFDELLHKALGAEKQTIAHYRVQSLARASVAGASNLFEVQGELSLAGVTNRLQALAEVTTVEAGMLKFSGRAMVKISNSQLKPDLPMIVCPGPLKYEDEVRLSFVFLFQKPAGKRAAKGVAPPSKYAHGFRVPAVGRLYADRTVGTCSTCELHDMTMKRESVAVVASGILDFNFKSTPYPHGAQPIGSGCVGPGEKPVFGYTWICQECERAWEKAGRLR